MTRLRGEWGIENGVHYRREVMLQKDACMLRRGQGPQVLVVIHNVVIGLVAQQGLSNLAAAQRAFAHAFDRVLAHLHPSPATPR